MSAPAVGPHRPEVEINVLGACLQNLAAAQTACRLLAPSDFFDSTRGVVFGIVKSLVAHDIPPDLVTVFQAATDHATQGRVTGALLQDLVDQTPTAANVAHHAPIVKDLAARRSLAALCTHYREAATKDGADRGPRGRNAGTLGPLDPRAKRRRPRPRVSGRRETRGSLVALAGTFP